MSRRGGIPAVHGREEVNDRYEHLARHADAGLGSAELGLRRFTRWADCAAEGAAHGRAEGHHSRADTGHRRHRRHRHRR